MKHLTHAELVEAIESPGRLSDRSANHLQACAGCRSEADALREVLDRAAGDRVPEPSPLFWDHFAARVSEAARREPIPAETPSWLERVQRPLTTWALVAAAAVLVLVTVAWRATLHAPSPAGAPATTAAVQGVSPRATALDSPSADNVDADAAWAVVRVAAEDLAWDDVHDAGISASSGAAEGLAMELTADERSELARLLEQELKRNGV